MSNKDWVNKERKSWATVCLLILEMPFVIDLVQQTSLGKAYIS